MTIVIFFILGLIVGSFLNVLVIRLRLAEKIIFDRSKCRHCKKTIRWHDNIPLLSFVLLLGRCRDCQKKISWQYPAVEFSTGIMFTLISIQFFSFENFETWVPTLFYLVLFSILMVILAYDWLYMEIPGIVLWTGVALSILFNIYFDWSNHLFGGELMLTKTFGGILGAGIAFLFFFSLSYFSKEKWMGMGDAYLAILLALILGFPQIFYALIIGFFLGSVLGIILMILGKKKMKSRLPLAPFLIIGTLIVIFLYPQISYWYWGLFF